MGIRPWINAYATVVRIVSKLLKSLQSIGMKEIPSNRYHAVDLIVCLERKNQVGCDFSFPKLECVSGNCESCGVRRLEEKIRNVNFKFFQERKIVTWCKWMVPVGKSAPEKSQVRGTVGQAITELMTMLTLLKGHLFRANWHRNLFDFSRRNMQIGTIVQIFDFAMNFRNIYQDEVQSAF